MFVRIGLLADVAALAHESSGQVQEGPVVVV